MNAVNEFLKRIPDAFSPLREHAEKYVRFGADIDESSTVCVGRNPKIAPQYFVFQFFSSALPAWLAKRRAYEVPIDYLRFLATMNGCFAYGMSLYGFTPSLEATPGLLDRGVLQCHDLTTANETWIIEYNVPEPAFLFGDRHYSYTENVGYFMDELGPIRSILKSGRQIGHWTNMKDFLRDELAAAEEYYQSRTLRSK